MPPRETVGAEARRCLPAATRPHSQRPDSPQATTPPQSSRHGAPRSPSPSRSSSSLIRSISSNRSREGTRKREGPPSSPSLRRSKPKVGHVAARSQIIIFVDLEECAGMGRMRSSKMTHPPVPVLLLHVDLQKVSPVARSVARTRKVASFSRDRYYLSRLKINSPVDVLRERTSTELSHGTSRDYRAIPRKDGAGSPTMRRTCSPGAGRRRG